MRANNIYVVRRITINLVIISINALAQSMRREASFDPLSFFFAALIDAGLALPRRPRLQFRALSYWDEAGLFFAQGVVPVTFAST
jgi:hypothetical protein